MKFYEIIYETGNYSVAAYEDDDEAIRAISNHHRRATSGELAQESNPQMGPAERVVKVLKYDEHPANFNEAQVVTTTDVTKAVSDAVESKKVGNLVSAPEIAAVVREMTSPLNDNPAPHKSKYKMQSIAELDKGDWTGAE